MSTLVQANTQAAAKKILNVDVDTFAKLKSVNLKDKVMLFDLTYLLSIINAGDKILDYEKVVVTVLQQDLPTTATDLPASSNFSGTSDGFEKYSINFKDAADANLAPAQKDMVFRYVYPKPIADRLFAGKFLLQNAHRKPNYVANVVSQINVALKEAISKNFSGTEIVPSVVKKPSVITTKSSEIVNHDNMIDDINRFLYDVTEPAVENFNSELDISSLSFQEEASKKVFHAELLRYYLHVIPSSPKETSLIFYDKITTVNKIKNFEGTVSVQIPLANKNLNLDVRFELYRIGALVPEEVVTSRLNVSRHFSVFSSINIPPQVSATQNELNYVNIAISDKNDPGKVDKFNIYEKSIEENGYFSDYRLIGTIIKSNTNTFGYFSSTKLSIVRVVPVDPYGNESNVFTNVTVGPGYDNINNFTICPRHDASGHRISLDLYNIPKDATKVLLYRRNCSFNVNQKFSMVCETPITLGAKTFTINDNDIIVPGDIFEYYAVCFTKGKTQNPSDKKVISNYAFLRHPFVPPEGKSVFVNIKNFSYQAFTKSPDVSFTIVSSLSREQKELITALVKSQIPEIYEQFLSPANNSSSPLDDEKFADLIVHEVIRTNLKTAEREVFNLIADGEFFDNPTSRRLSNVKPIDPTADYMYQVFSYLKNPVSLFKNYIISGKDQKGKEWFYLPYKWKQPTVIASGQLYADDANGIPIIDSYESLTAEPLGLTASKLLKSQLQNAKIHGTKAERLDRNTVQITWNISTNTESLTKDFHDSYIVMKVVNGIRSFVGRTSKNFIYHNVDVTDMGCVYYIVLPIMKDFSFDDVDYSNDIIIDDKVSKKIILPPVLPLGNLNVSQ